MGGGGGGIIPGGVKERHEGYEDYEGPVKKGESKGKWGERRGSAAPRTGPSWARSSRVGNDKLEKIVQGGGLRRQGMT